MEVVYHQTLPFFNLKCATTPTREHLSVRHEAIADADARVPCCRHSMQHNNRCPTSYCITQGTGMNLPKKLFEGNRIQVRIPGVLGSS